MESSTTSLVIPCGDVALAARLHCDGAAFAERRPTVIVAGSWLTVKEQMADLYAARLAALGYRALTFDFSGFGASGGSLRQAEIPSRKIADLRTVAEWASATTLAPPGGLGVVAVCASAQYTLAALAGGLPVSAFASVAGWFHDTESVAPFYGGADGVRQRIARSADAAERFLADGETVMVPAYDPDDEAAAMTIEMEYYASPARGAVSTWRNEMAELSWRHWLGFDGITPAAAVEVPTLFVHSEQAVLPGNVRAIAERMAGPVEQAWLDGEQTDFYDQAAQVDAAVEAVHAHLRTHLRGDE